MCIFISVCVEMLGGQSVVMTGTAVEEIIGFPALNFAVNKHHAMSGQGYVKIRQE